MKIIVGIIIVLIIWAVFSFATIWFDRSKIHFTKHSETANLLWLVLFIVIVSGIFVIIAKIIGH